MIVSQPHTLFLCWQSRALLVTCPTCKRTRVQVCCDPRGKDLWGRPHRSRIKAAFALPQGEGLRRNDKANPSAGLPRQAGRWLAHERPRLGRP